MVFMGKSHSLKKLFYLDGQGWVSSAEVLKYLELPELQILKSQDNPGWKEFKESPVQSSCATISWKLVD